MIKKLYISTVVLLFAILSMSVSVFAWFTGNDDSVNAKDLSGTTESVDETLGIGDEDNSLEIFRGYRANDLIYLTNEDFAKETAASELYGLASITPITINNASDENLKVRIRMDFYNATEYGELSGKKEGIEYLILPNGDENGFIGKYNEIKDNPHLQLGKFVTKASSDLINQKNIYNVPANSSTILYVYVWGNYSKLTANHQANYHSLVYRVGLVAEVIRG